MASPSIPAAPTTTNGTTAAASKTINLPSNVAIGETLCCLIRTDGVGSYTFPAGWQKLWDDASDASDDQTCFAYLFVDAAQSSTMSVTSANGRFAAITFRVQGAVWKAPQFPTLVTGTSVNPNPGSLTITGGSRDYLFVWLGGWEGEQTSPPASNPTNYGSNIAGANSGTAGAVTSNCRVAMASRTATTAGPEDAALWAISVSDDWTATIACFSPEVTATDSDAVGLTEVADNSRRGIQVSDTAAVIESDVTSVVNRVNVADTLPVIVSDGTQAALTLNSGLLNYWKMDEASGTRSDSVGTDHLSEQGGTTNSGTGLVYGNAADFEADNQFWMQAGDTTGLSIANTDATFAYWVNYETLVATMQDMGKGTAAGFEWLIGFSTENFRLLFRVTTDGSTETKIEDGGGFGGGNSLSTGTWYLVIVWHDATNDQIGIASSVNSMTAYTTSFSSSGVWDSNGDYQVGRPSGFFPSYTDGRIGPVMHWNRVLTSQERTDLYNSGAGRTLAAIQSGGAVTNTLDLRVSVSPADTDVVQDSEVAVIVVSTFGFDVAVTGIDSEKVQASEAAFAATVITGIDTGVVQVSDSQTLLTGLRSMWRMEEASGTRADSMGVNDLTDNNTVTSATGKVGTAADFESTNSESLSRTAASCVGLAASGRQSFTIAAWVQLESLGGGNYRGIVTKQTATVVEYEFGLGTTDVLEFGMEDSGGNNGTVVQWSSAASTATWYFVVAWYDAVAQTINIQVNNGTAQSQSFTFEPALNGTGDFYIGSTAPFNLPWDGLIDQVMFYNRTLSSAERSALYNSGNGRDFSDLGTLHFEPIDVRVLVTPPDSDAVVLNPENNAIVVTTVGADVAVVGIDTDVVQLSEQAFPLVRVDITESVKVQVSEQTFPLVRVDTTDSDAVQVSEQSFPLVRVDVTDSDAVQASDLAFLSVLITAQETLVVQVADLAFLLVMVAVADTEVVQVSDAAFGFGSGSASDSEQIGTNDALDLRVSVSPPETVVTQVSEQAFISTLISAAESLAVQIAEQTALVVSVAVSDGVVLQLSEVIAVLASLAVSDANGVQASDRIDVLARADVSDTSTVGLTENAALAALIAATEAIRAQVSEQTDIRVSVNTADGVAVQVSESSGSLAVLVACAEALGCTVAEATEILVRIAATEQCAVILSDTAAIFISEDGGMVAITASDTLTIAIADLAFIAGTLSASDSIASQASEDTFIAGTLSAADQIAVILAEQAAVAALITASDAAAIRSQEQAALLVMVTAADAEAIGLSEMARLLVSLDVSEVVVVVASDAAFGAGTLSASDSGVIVANESAAIYSVLDAADILGLSVSELAALLDMRTASDSVAVQVVEGTAQITETDAGFPHKPPTEGTVPLRRTWIFRARNFRTRQRW